jgi:hypothetical protein
LGSRLIRERHFQTVRAKSGPRTFMTAP